jgi:RNA polymerase sigma-70 factor (ECF subfamily)
MQHKLELIWSNFHNELERFIYSRVKEQDVTNDILQDIFIKIHNNIGNLRDETKLSAWIYQITRNSINDYFRKQKAQIDSSEFDGVEEIPNSDNDKLENCMIPFIDQLDDKYKEALMLTEFNGLSQKQLAQKLNISYSGAKSRVQRAKEYLRNIFTDCCSIQSDKYGNIIDFQQKSTCKNCCD